MSDDPIAAFLNRAGSILRELAEPGWDRIADAVIDAVRATPRGGFPLFATDPDESSVKGSISVSDLVLRGVLARAVRLEQLCAPSGIDIAAEGAELKRIRIELTARYGSELREVAEQVRLVAIAVVEDLLGDLSANRNTIEVVITDVVDGDPLTE